MIYPKISVGIFFLIVCDVSILGQQDNVFSTNTLCDPINATERRGTCFCVCPMDLTNTCMFIEIDLSSNSGLTCFWTVNMISQQSPYVYDKTGTSLQLRTRKVSASDHEIFVVCQNYYNHEDIVVDVIFKGKKLENIMVYYSTDVAIHELYIYYNIYS